MSTYLDINGHTCSISDYVANSLVRHIAVTFKDGEVPRFYVNGNYINYGSAPDVDASDTSDLFIGNNEESTENIQSKIKHLIICNKRLTDLEIRALYEASAKIDESVETYSHISIDFLVEDETGYYLLDDETGYNLIEG